MTQNYKAQLQTVLYDLKNKPHCLLEKKANELETLIKSYIAGDMPMDGDEALDAITPEPQIEGGIAIISINGIICKRLGLPQEILDLFGLCDLDNVDAQLMEVMSDANVNAVILNVCSPGGFITGVQSTANLIGKLAEIKETVVYSDVLNASAAYWLSSQASSIIVSIDAELGSIGVYTQVWDMSKALEMQGIKVTLIKAGKYKAIGDETQPLSDEAKTFLQDEVNATWELFKGAVNNKRTVAPEYMEGQTYSGEKVIEYGLADGIANSIEEVIAALGDEPLAE